MLEISGVLHARASELKLLMLFGLRTRRGLPAARPNPRLIAPNK